MLHDLIKVFANDVVVGGGARTLAQRTRAQGNTTVDFVGNVGAVTSVVHSLDLLVCYSIKSIRPYTKCKKNISILFSFWRDIENKI